MFAGWRLSPSRVMARRDGTKLAGAPTPDDGHAARQGALPRCDSHISRLREADVPRLSSLSPVLFAGS